MIQYFMKQKSTDEIYIPDWLKEVTRDLAKEKITENDIITIWSAVLSPYLTESNAFAKLLLTLLSSKAMDETTHNIIASYIVLTSVIPTIYSDKNAVDLLKAYVVLREYIIKSYVLSDKMRTHLWKKAITTTLPSDFLQYDSAFMKSMFHPDKVLSRDALEKFISKDSDQWRLLGVGAMVFTGKFSDLEFVESIVEFSQSYSKYRLIRDLKNVLQGFLESSKLELSSDQRDLFIVLLKEKADVPTKISNDKLQALAVRYGLMEDINELNISTLKRINTILKSIKDYSKDYAQTSNSVELLKTFEEEFNVSQSE